MVALLSVARCQFIAFRGRDESEVFKTSAESSLHLDIRPMCSLLTLVFLALNDGTRKLNIPRCMKEGSGGGGHTRK